MVFMVPCPHVITRLRHSFTGDSSNAHIPRGLDRVLSTKSLSELGNYTHLTFLIFKVYIALRVTEY